MMEIIKKGKGVIMSIGLRIVLGIFFILHGLVHPIMALVPAPNQNPPILGDFWKRSWLFGDGPAIKAMIFILAGLCFVVFLAAGLSLMGIIFPVAWVKGLILAGAIISLVTLIVFWNTWFVVGIVINIALLIAAFAVKWPVNV